MIEVFKTNVSGVQEAEHIRGLLQQQLPHTRINFDLHDCDNILRVEGAHIVASQITMIVSRAGFKCDPLE